MKGDFSRSTFDPRKHYNGVHMQQGRVQLDADWNENLDILLHRIETETIDVVGECGVPVHNPAFGVATNFSSLSQEEKDLLTEWGFSTLKAGDFYLSRGRAYVDGILIENDETLPFSQQPFVLPAGGDAITAAGTYLLYLDIWERHVTALEDPSIREVALGGPDTATRSQVIWQAVLAAVGDPGINEIVTCADDIHPWPDASTGTLAARTHPEDLPSDPCDIAPGAGYKRLENQLYRVEIHKGCDASTGPTFKWSRDNGSVVVAVSEFAVDGSTTKVRTSSLGRDDVLGLHENDWVEILDDATELAGLPGTLVQITKIDPDNILTLSGSVSGYDINAHPKVRRWDMDSEQTVSVPTTNDGYLKLEGGVEVKFDISGTFRSGDYWLIPARTVPGQYGDIEWPKSGGNPKAMLPFGITHHYCKLAVITSEEINHVITITNVEDCRRRFPPLTELPAGGKCCCSVSVGENGDFPDIQTALDARPSDTHEWRICVMAGEYNLAATITAENAHGLVISGCGRQTHIYGPQDAPAFSFNKADTVQIDNLWIEASSPSGGIIFTSSRSIEIRENLLVNQLQPVIESGADSFMNHENSGRVWGRSAIPAPLIIIDNGADVIISDNNLFGLPAVLASGRNLFVLRNRITGGGIQIVPPANLIQIEDNTIIKGQGPGIQLGGGEKDASDFLYGYGASNKDESGAAVSMDSKSKNPLAGIRIVTISRNLIGGMQGSGIVTALQLSDLLRLSDVETLAISHNQIVNCCQKPDVVLSKNTRIGGGMALVSVFGAQIDHNFVASNGSDKMPACGIFLFDGSDINIDDNIIVENGVSEQNSKPNTYQAGIAAQFVLGNHLGIGQTDNAKNGYPALRIRGNEVICPAGQALTILAVGGVVVDGNTLVTRERLQQPTEPLNFSEKGACVAIHDLGLPVWLPDIALLLQLMSAGKVNMHLEDGKLEELFTDYPDGRVLFHNNQVTFNTDIKEDVESLGEMNTGWPQRIWNAATFAALFSSLDDVSLNANQFQSSAPAYALDGLELYMQEKISLADFLAYVLKFIHVGSGAISIRASNNAITERWFSNSVSYASNAAMMNITTGNEATHSLVTNAPKKVQEHNLSLTS
ncbi:MAG: hypothetical protein JEZ00_05245 [Anaerolineaceae bacterium]|nr:hypothetical protein [Anaerolineaceae bacterium]